MGEAFRQEGQSMQFRPVDALHIAMVLVAALLFSTGRDCHASVFVAVESLLAHAGTVQTSLCCTQHIGNLENPLHCPFSELSADGASAMVQPSAVSTIGETTFDYGEITHAAL